MVFIVLSLVLMIICTIFNLAWWGYIIAELIFALFYFLASNSSGSSRKSGGGIDFPDFDIDFGDGGD